MKLEVVHIIGAGIAGLAAAAELAAHGVRVRVYEAAPQAGGRCRSFFDKALQTEIDNGNHLLLGVNRAVLGLIHRAKAYDKLHKIAGNFPFVDARDGTRWNFPGKVPGVPASAIYAALPKLLLAKKEATVAQCFSGPLYEKLIRPLGVSILNTPPEIASATLFRRVLGELALGGKKGIAAYIPKTTWNDALVQPLVEYIKMQGGEVGISCRVKELRMQGGRVALLRLENCTVEVGANDAVILAVPSFAAVELLPGLTVPTEHMPIVNVHYKVPESGIQNSVTGIIGGTAEWIFTRDGMLSTTTSAAVELVDEEDEMIAAMVWKDVLACHPALVAGLNTGPTRTPQQVRSDIPLYRVIKEKRATFAATPENLRKRPGIRTEFTNLFLAGDYTDTGLPATMEGAVRSASKFLNINV